MSDVSQHAAPQPSPAVPDPVPAPLRDEGVPPNLVFLTVIVGIIFTAAGGYYAIQAVTYTPGVHFAALIACCGLGMTLVAVGGKAVGTWKNWSVAGAAAAAPLLFLLQLEFQPKPVESGFVRGELRGTGHFQQITIWGHDSPLYVRKPNPSQNFQFVAFDRQIAETGRFFIVVVNEDGKSPQTFTINCLEGELFKKRQATSAPLQLAIRPGPAASGNPTWFVFDSDNKKLGKFNDDDCDKSVDTQSITLGPAPSPREPGRRALPSFRIGLIGAAYAQGLPQAFTPVQLVKSLNSESSDQRVSSRIELSKLTQPEQLNEISGSWSTGSSSYREDLGLVTAWNTAISNDRAAAVRIAQGLSPLQLKYLVALSGYPDQTMRYGATKLISWLLQTLAWPNGVGADRGKVIAEAVLQGLSDPSPTAIRRDVQFQPDTMTANLLVALDWSDCSIVRFDRSKTSTVLKSLQERSSLSESARTMAKKVLEHLTKCPT